MALLTTNKNKTPLGIYVHIPFCRSKCQYCDFYSVTEHDKSLTDGYLEAVCAHIKEAGALAPNHQVDTIYFGGGTPSFFGAEGLATILTAIRRAFDVAADAEITFEANPDSVNDRDLRRLAAEGFNRASLGVQSDDDAMLQRLGRPHTFDQVLTAMKRLRKAGFRNVSIDLMYGLPEQTLAQWRSTLENCLSLNPEHISCYGLTVEKGTPLYTYQSAAGLPDDDTQADMYLAAVQLLKQRGYRQYEISNFAKRGRASRHNLKYWTGGEYLSFGPNATSDFAGKRYTLIRDVKGYIRGLKEGGSVIAELTEIPVRERAGEYLMLRLRTVGGIQAEEYEKQFLLPFGPLEAVLQRCADHGLATFAKERWRLTPEGMLVSNAIIRDLQLAQERSQPLAKRRK